MRTRILRGQPITKRLILMLAFALLSCSCNATSLHSRNYSAAIQEAQNAAYEVLRQGGTSVGIALVTRDKVVLAGGYGMADIASSAPVTSDTMFPIGSVSKIFAAVAVMQLVDRGLVDLDKPIDNYLPSFRMADPRYNKITVRMLLSHTSGIPGTRYTGAETTVALHGYAQAVMASLADQRLKADPGAFAVYCNDGFTLVDPLVAAVTGMSYVDWVKQKIFEPLGMKNTMFSQFAPDKSGCAGAVISTDHSKQCRNFQQLPPLQSLSVMKGTPSGGLCGSERHRCRYLSPEHARGGSMTTASRHSNLAA